MLRGQIRCSLLTLNLRSITTSRHRFHSSPLLSINRGIGSIVMTTEYCHYRWRFHLPIFPVSKRREVATILVERLLPRKNVSWQFCLCHGVGYGFAVFGDGHERRERKAIELAFWQGWLKLMSCFESFCWVLRES
jgi:hypothetical protein